MPISSEIRMLIEKNDSKVTSLDLSNASIDDEDVEELQELLEKNSYIKFLDLSNNKITDSAAKSLALIKVEKVNLSNNYLGDEGAIILINNLHIKELDISANGLTSKSAKAFLKHISQYKKLEIDDNPRISAELKKAIRDNFIKCPTSFSEPIGIDLGLNIGHESHSQMLYFKPILLQVDVKKLGEKIYQEYEPELQKLTSAQTKELLDSLLLYINDKSKIQDYIKTPASSHKIS